MAEKFTNAFGRGVGIVTSSANGVVGASTDRITGVGTTGVNVGDMLDTLNWIGGTKVASIVVPDTIVLDRYSTNVSSVTNQSVKVLGVTTTYTSPADTKSILIGGTLTNNTTNQVGASVQIATGSTSYNLMWDVPIPSGSSFVISDAGKTTLLAGEEVRILCDTANALDVSISILQGVN